MISVMTSETSQQDSEAENEHLMAHHDEEKLSNSTGLYPTRKKWSPLTKLGPVTLLLLTALISALLSSLTLHFLHVMHSRSKSGEIFGSCGSTPNSARLSNCTFDLMSFSWLPTACSDAELTAEFAALRNWTWWEDANQAVSVSLEAVERGDRKELFVTREYHMFHCTYMWRKLHRGMLSGVVDTYIGSYGHTEHCEMMLLGMEGEGSVNRTVTDTAIWMKFPRCMWI